MEKYLSNSSSSRWSEQGEFTQTGSLCRHARKREDASGSPLSVSALRQIAGMTILCLMLGACAKQQAVGFNTYGVEKGAGSVGVHTVLAGDTVYKIANNYQLPMREIITLNNMQAPYVLNAGFRMKLPPPNEHEVREGDSVTSIARMYEVSPNRLAQLNGLEAPYKLMTRMKLRLPPSSGGAVESAGVQTVNFAESVEVARIQPVERQSIEQRSIQHAAIKPNTKPVPPKTKGAKASVKKVSVQRAKLPKHTPKMSSSNGRFMRPVNGKIISNYGPKEGGLYNDGINIKAVRGAPVRAAENGVVVYTGDDLEGYGNLILVRHENRMMSAYAHLDKTLIKRGATVKRGQSIGTVGSTGQVDSPQLHFEVRRGSKALNPLKYL